MLRAVLTRTQSNLICTTCRNNFISRVNSVQKVLPVAAPVFRQFHYSPVHNWFWTPKDDITFLGRTLRKLGFTYIPKSVLKQCGYLIYMKIADELDYMKFFKILDLPDTYASWFTVLELHVWLICARLMQDGKEGRIVRNSLIKAMWEYNEAKSKKLEGALPSARKRDLQFMNDQFHAAMIAYDEGLLGDDYILAGALWRRFIRLSDPAQSLSTSTQKIDETSQDILANQAKGIELLVLYVRSQYYSLNNLSQEQLLRKRAIKWDSFDETLLDLAAKMEKSSSSEVKAFR